MIKLYRGTGNKLHVSRACAGPNGALDTVVLEDDFDRMDRGGCICRRCKDYRTAGGHRP